MSKPFPLLVLGGTLLFLSNAYGIDLVGAFRLAQENDPRYLAASAENQANQELLPQARSFLLPNLSASGDLTGNRLDIVESTFTRTGRRQFNEKALSLSLVQPLFRRELWIQLKQASDQVRQSEVRFTLARQDLILRLAEAYFGVLQAMDELRFARTEKKALEQQLEQAEQRFEVGLVAVTDVQEAQAGFDAARAREIAAINQLNNAIEALRAITGRYLTDLAVVGPDLPLVTPEPNDIELWTKTGLEQNLSVQIAQLTADIAEKDIKRAEAGHLPTLDLVGSHTYSDTGGGVFGGTRSHNTALGLQLNLPIYQGGLVMSQTRQARAQYQQALDQLLLERRETQRQTREAFLGILTSISQVEALRQAVVSARVAKEATDAGFEVGTRTAVDVVVATRNVTQQERNLSLERISYLLDILRLKQAAGVLSDADLAEINRLLAP